MSKGTLEMQWREMGREVGMGMGMFLLLTIVAMASGRSAFAQTEIVTVDIPPQELSTALTVLADQTNLQVLYASELTRGLTTNGVVGTVRPQDAVRQLLEGTGLEYTFTEGKTVTLQSALPAGAAVGAATIVLEGAKSKPMKVPEIVVKDVRERNDNKDYVVEEAGTATRTDTPLLQGPQSVGVVSQRVIEDQRAIRMEQALRNVSGIAIAQSNEGEAANDRLFCRGFPCVFFKNNLRNDDANQVFTFRDMSNVQPPEVSEGLDYR